MNTAKAYLVLLLGGVLFGLRLAVKKSSSGPLAAFFRRLDQSMFLTIAFCLVAACLMIGILFAWEYWQHRRSEKLIAREKR